MGIIALIKMLLLLLVILLIAPLAWVAKRLGRQRYADILFRFLARCFLFIAGIRLTVRGELSVQRPLLLVTNHLSYADIPLLAAANMVRFLPKSEIASWPILGWMCRISGAVFINRKPESLVENSNQIRQALAKGEPVCLFPEGTTGNGIKLQPFKSSFFSLAEEAIDGQELQVQPAAIAYRRIHNLPIDMTQWPHIAWYGDMTLVPHLWRFLQMAPISAEVIYLEPVALSRFANRKELSHYCQDVITEALNGDKN